MSKHGKPYQKVHLPIASLHEASTNKLCSRTRSTCARTDSYSQLALHVVNCLVNLRAIYSEYIHQKEIKQVTLVQIGQGLWIHGQLVVRCPKNVLLLSVLVDGSIFPGW